ncbi:MAG: hypothetical protein V1820_04705 [archaeon]
MGKNAQSSFELLFSWGLVLLLFTAMMGVYLDKAGYLARESDALESRAIAEEFASAANSVHLSGPGALASFWLKHSLKSGENYTLRVVGNRVEANWSGGISDAALLFSNINSTGNISIVAGRETNLSDVGGVVHVFQ